MRFAPRTPKAAQNLRDLGASEQEIDAVLGPAPGDADALPGGELVEVWPEHEPALALLLRLRTQWHWVGGMGTARVGINLGAADVVRRAMHISDAEWLAELDRLHICECAVLSAEQALREQAKKE